MFINLGVYAIYLGLLIRSVMADISLATISGSFTTSQTMEIKWVDDNREPKLSELTTANFLLCTGPNSALHCFSTPLSTKESIADMNGVYKLDLSKVASFGTNGPYFVQMTSLVKGSTGGYTIHYSSRFSISGMTGNFQATSGGDTTPPQAQINLKGLDYGATGDPAKSENIPYTAQTGGIRYAPMQLQPGTTVTRQLVASARYPTSSVSYYKTVVSPAYCSSTITPSWSYTFSALTNYASVMPTPSGWYQATAVRASSIIAKVQSAQRRRWLD